MAEEQIQLSVVIPAYNEMEIIARTVGDLVKALDAAGISFEIICANNNSTDKTADVVSVLNAEDPRIRLVNTPPIKGYGVAVRSGLNHIKGEAAVICMADGADSPDDVVAYYRSLTSGTFDCAFGSRFIVANSTQNYPKLKYLINRVGNLFLRFLLRSKYDDFTNGFKCYRADFLHDIGPFICNEFNLTLEMSLKAIMAGGRYAVVPNVWKQRDMGVSSFSVFRQSMLYLVTITYLLLDRFLKKDKYEVMRKRERTIS